MLHIFGEYPVSSVLLLWKVSALVYFLYARYRFTNFDSQVDVTIASSSSSHLFSENSITQSLLSNEHTRKAARDGHAKKCDQCVQCDQCDLLLPSAVGRTSEGPSIARLGNHNPPPHARGQSTFPRPLPPVSCSWLISLSGVISAPALSFRAWYRSIALYALIALVWPAREARDSLTEWLAACVTNEGLKKQS